MNRTIDQWMRDNSFKPEDHKFIFQQLVALYSTEMADIGITHTHPGSSPEDIDVLLDMQYLYQFSNQRVMSGFFERMAGTAIDAVALASKLRVVAELIYFRFYLKWKKLYDLNIQNYNPLHNYDMTEHEEVNTYVESTRGVENNVFGFNTTSLNGVPQSKGSQSDVVDGDKANNYTDHTKSGNIGVTTTQKMFQEELEVRKFNFYEQMFKDINSILCLKIY